MQQKVNARCFQEPFYDFFCTLHAAELFLSFELRIKKNIGKKNFLPYTLLVRRQENIAIVHTVES
jgi:hypothetical protein